MQTRSALLVAGEIDLATAPEFARAVQAWCTANPVGDIELDCGQLRFIDSCGLHVLFNTARTLAEQQRTLVISNLPAPARKVAEIVRLDAVAVLA
jgi:anti-anti-sigma factor